MSSKNNRGEKTASSIRSSWFRRPRSRRKNNSWLHQVLTYARKL